MFHNSNNDCLTQDCGKSSTLAMELPKSWAKPSIYSSQVPGWAQLHTHLSIIPSRHNAVVLDISSGNTEFCVLHSNISLKQTKAEVTFHTPQLCIDSVDWSSKNESWPNRVEDDPARSNFIVIIAVKCSNGFYCVLTSIIPWGSSSSCGS